MLSSILSVLYIIFITWLCVRILLDTDSPHKAVIYIFLAIAIPVFGALLYFIFGINYRRKKLYKRKMRSDKEAYNKLQSDINFTEDSRLPMEQTGLDQFKSLARLINQEKNLSSDNNRVELIINGENKFPDVFEAIKNACHHIHLEYYIFNSDEIGNELGNLLIKKAREGVEIRLVYDDFGSMSIDNKFIRELRKAGVKTACFQEIKWYVLANRVNYRNHRKIIIIDGLIGYVGGINVSDKYINGRNKVPFWRDTHLKIEGYSVFALQNLFINDWNFCCDEKIDFSSAYFPVDKEAEKFGNQFVQITASGLDSEYPNILYSLVLAIYLAREEVLITTPYFIPESTFLDALKIADLREVDVKILVPAESDSMLTDAVSRSYYRELLEAGVEIYQYNKGFIHAKTMVCDGKLSMVGTANMDQRSFDLNFEVNAVIYDGRFGNELKNRFYEDLEDTEQLDLAEWRSRPFYKIIYERLLRIISPIL